MKTYFPTFVCAWLCTAASAFASEIEEELIVTATTVPKPASQVGSAVTVLSAEDLTQRMRISAAEVLREVPGTSINQSGPQGAITQARLRGAEGNHTQVRIDGIEVNDPGFGSEFDFAHLPAFDLERIEILRGSQSALYGSDAIGGVISVYTPTPEPDSATGAVSVAAGNESSQRAGAAFALANDTAYIRGSGYHYSTEGENASEFGSERDGYRLNAWTVKSGWQPSDNWTITAVHRQERSDAETDGQDFAFPSTPTQGLAIDTEDETRARRAYSGLTATYGSANMQHNLRYTHARTQADFRVGHAVSANNRGEREQLAYDGVWSFTTDRTQQSVTFGAQWQRLGFANRSPSFAAANNTEDDIERSIIAEYLLDFAERVSVGASFRRDTHDRYANANTYRLTVTTQLTNPLRLRASYGEGVTNPTFFEVFGFIPASFNGNPSLRPESASGFDIGLSGTHGEFAWTVGYFEHDLEDEITTVFDSATFLSTPINLSDESERRGAELDLAYRIGGFDMSLSYTYLDSRDGGDRRETRRPRHTGSLNVNRSFANALHINLGVIHNGETLDNEFVFATLQDRVSLDAYTLVNAAVRYDVSERLSVTLSASNLLDEEYEEVFSYAAPGRRWLLGFEARL